MKRKKSYLEIVETDQCESEKVIVTSKGGMPLSVSALRQWFSRYVPFGNQEKGDPPSDP